MEEWKDTAKRTKKSVCCQVMFLIFCVQNNICFTKDGKFKSCEEILNELEAGEDRDGQGVGSQSENGEVNESDKNNNDRNRETISFPSPGDDAEQSGIAWLFKGVECGDGKPPP
jgi:hypothetical protein